MINASRRATRPRSGERRLWRLTADPGHRQISAGSTAGGAVMIEVYTWPTPNGHKIHIALEELGLPYRAIAVDIAKGDQFRPEFLKISPNNKIPALVDPEGIGGKRMALMESAAILIYLADKTGKLMPANPRDRLVA